MLSQIKQQTTIYTKPNNRSRREYFLDEKILIEKLFIHCFIFNVGEYLGVMYFCFDGPGQIEFQALFRFPAFHALSTSRAIHIFYMPKMISYMPRD